LRLDQSVWRYYLVGALWLLLGLLTLVFQLFQRPSIRIEWITATEFNTAGFNILRSDEMEGTFVQINEHLIPAQGNVTSGTQYVFVDDQVEGGRTYYYILEDVEYDNTRQRHPATSGTATLLGAVPLAIITVSMLSSLSLFAFPHLTRRRL
jgi:hypothetical protein